MKTRYEKKELQDNMLTHVCGGNEGDTAQDTNINDSMYKLNQPVKLIGKGFLFEDLDTTIEGIIFENGHWYYGYSDDYSMAGKKMSYIRWVTADEIRC